MLTKESIRAGQVLTAIDHVTCSNLTSGKVYLANDGRGTCQTTSGNCVYVITDRGERFGPYLHNFKETRHLCQCEDHPRNKIPKLRIRDTRLLLCERV